MRLLVSGYREFTDKEIIEKEILEIFNLYGLPKEEQHTIIHGGCTGVDLIAGEIADEQKITQHSFPVSSSEWKQLGKKAGPLRNQKMIDEGKPTFALLFLSKKSKGTKDMLNRIEKAGLSHVLVHID